jgi:hypothetical protein
LELVGAFPATGAVVVGSLGVTACALKHPALFTGVLTKLTSGIPLDTFTVRFYYFYKIAHLLGV